MAIDIIETWANTGDITIIPDDTQPDGSVSFKQGWGNDYQLDPATVSNAKKLSRSNFNYLFSLLTTNQQEQLLYGFNNHIVGKTYPIMARVRGADGLIYESTVETNTTPPSADWIEFGGAGDEFALLNGDENETFKVAGATEDNQAVNLGQFERFGTDIAGGFKLPNGLIIQWGSGDDFPTTGDSSKSVIFPISFNNAVLYASWTPIAPFLSVNISAYITSITNSGMTLIADKQGGETVTIGYNYIAIGY